MPETSASMETWLRKLLGAAPDSPRMDLREYLAGIPQLESLADVPRGTRVLVRGDLDAKPGPTLGKGDIRLRSMQETLDYGRSRGWVQVIFGHIGRDPKGSLDKVRDRLAEILKCEVGFLADWLDPQTTTILDEAAAKIQSARPGDVLLLENARKYDVETVLWKVKPEGIPGVAPRLAKLANEFAQKLGRVYVNEAFSAGSLDSSTIVVPAAMDRVALGRYVAGQFLGPLMDCLDAQMVVSSGLKIDKLDDLEAMISRGRIRRVFVAGSLAVGLKKAAAELDGQECGIDCGGPCPTACGTERLLLDVFDGTAPCTGDCSRDVQGGLLETGGWTPLDGASRLVYDFGRHVDCGRLTVEVDNFDPWNQFQPRDLTDPYTEFLSLFDGREDNPSDRFNHYSDYSQIDVVYPPACFDPGDPTCTPNYSQIKPNTGLLTACDWDSGRYCADCLQLGTTHYVFELEWTVQGLSMSVNDVEQTYYAYPVYPNASCTFTCNAKTPELQYLYVGRPGMDWQGYLVGPIYRRVELEATVE